MATTEASGVRVELRRLLEIAALAGLALVQPTLDVLGRSPETFVFRGVDSAELVVFALAVAVLPAQVIWGLGLVTRLAGERVRATVHLATIGVLAALAVLVALKSAEALFGLGALTVAVVVGLGAVALYVRVAGVRLFLGYLSVLPLLAAGAFLLTSPTADLVRGPDHAVVEDPGTTTPLVVLVLDELPTAAIIDDDGAVDAERFPNLAALAEESRWYRNYTTVNNFTLHAVPALLSGMAPATGEEALLADHPDNLFTLLGGTYEFNVDEAVTRLCPTDLCPPRGAGAGRRGLRGLVEDTRGVLRALVSLDDFPTVESDAFVERVVEREDAEPTRFQRFLHGLEPTPAPGLHVLHLVLPHEPWRFYADGTEYTPPDRDPRGDPEGRWTDPWPAELNRLRFELQARFVDELVGETVARLQETSLWDEAVIAVVSDHGASFEDGQGRRVLTETNADEIMWSALFVRAPGLEPGVTDVNMISTDLLPTLADLMGTEVPWETEGESVLDADDGSAASAGGEKVYYRFSNRWFDEPHAVLHIDSASTLEELLADVPRPFATDDPVGSLYRATPAGDLYGRPVRDVDVGAPLDAVALVQDLDGIEEGGSRVNGYVGGGVRGDAVEDDAWVVGVADGEVVGVSALFPDEFHERAFAFLLDADRAGAEGVDLELYAWQDGRLHLLRSEAE